MGVGVPLGVLALGLLSFLFWRERRKGGPKGDVATPMMAQNSGNAYTDQGQVNYAQRGTYPPEEQPKPHNPWSPSPTYEADANTAPQELRG